MTHSAPTHARRRLGGSHDPAVSCGARDPHRPDLRAQHPKLGSFPFFYWYQLLWVPVVALLTTICYLITTRVAHPAATDETRPEHYVADPKPAAPAPVPVAAAAAAADVD